MTPDSAALYRSHTPYFRTNFMTFVQAERRSKTPQNWNITCRTSGCVSQ